MAAWNGGSRRDYYRFLRTIYKMDALSAWERAKRCYAEWPCFMADPAGEARAALSKAKGSA